MKFSCLLNFMSLCVFINSQKTFLDSPKNIRLLQGVRLLSLEIFEKTGEKEKMRLVAREQDIVQAPVPENVPFPCNLTGSRSSKVPTSVHKLRPGDIDVIAAIGDSLIAGLGALATNIVHFLIENRGVSFMGGGEGSWREYLTLPNIFKEFNLKLIGYAESDSFSFQESAQFNLGTTGAMSQDLPFMAQVLVDKMKKDPRVDIKNQWKFVSIMIGANDFCSDMCYFSRPSLVVNNHESNLTMALRIIRDNLPRTFVSISPPPHIKDLYGLTGRRPYCEFILDIECPCFFGSRWNHQQRQEFFDIITKFQLMEEEIANYAEFQRNDFVVVVQPFTINLTFPFIGVNSDLTHIAPDCFHITQKAHARAANAIWNTLFEPVGQKTVDWDELFKKFNCPTLKRPYISTLQNSK